MGKKQSNPPPPSCVKPPPPPAPPPKGGLKRCEGTMPREIILELQPVEADIEGDKRQYFPYIAKSSCPRCGALNIRDLTNRGRYLDYPKFGEVVTIDFYCSGFAGGSNKSGKSCEREWTERVIPKLILEKAEDEVEERRFPIQDCGTIPWEAAERAYETYVKYFGGNQSLEQWAERGGFGVEEFCLLYRGINPLSLISDRKQIATAIVFTTSELGLEWDRSEVG
jgi:hypothetical protein